MTRILIADDHDVVRDGLRALIETRGDWTVVAEARNGQEALELATATQPDVVILDYAMPIMNGVEVARQLRARRLRAEVLIFTMHDDDALIRDALQAGVRGCLLKADARSHLFEAIETLARHKPYISGKVSGALLDAALDGRSRAASPLTPRERTIVQLIGEGRTNKEIGPILRISIKTVETHRASALRKLGARNTADLIRYAIRNRMIEV
ncbi:response regulator [Aurantimonas endophytica]|uniref:DNA-binding NarL/FixJ family response regulator n=1 Tax=Aurantimonas endophytica TaxID=1522175 RepID=A0A7W6HI19_9HYPH|nr:response regulator transcription factor [Aurantimonas endophytica]MBB4005639.1 DNA-binding NarL/FixJ family response regulator [Aurantimonas endophytica]MCO6406407.1 response regulator [Aurantimonas endophytica]